MTKEYKLPNKRMFLGDLEDFVENILLKRISKKKDIPNKITVLQRNFEGLNFIGTFALMTTVGDVLVKVKKYKKDK